MSFDQDPNEQANISGADLAMLDVENRALRAALSELVVTHDELQVWYRFAAVDETQDLVTPNDMRQRLLKGWIAARKALSTNGDKP